MQIDLPGLLRERMASGAYRWRVRTEIDKTRRIALSIPPDHPAFMEHYRAARAGIKLDPPAAPQAAIERSLGWLTYEFTAHMQGLVSAGLMDAGTALQRAAFYARLRAEYGDKDMAMPRHKLVEFRDRMTATPGAADNMVKAVRAMFAWAMQRGIVSENPATGLKKINRGKGAVPWSVADLKQFRDRHPQGTMAHLALSLFMFTSCRIGDVIHLGRENETRRAGITFLAFQPAKAGTSFVSVPLVPPLARAIAAQVVIGKTYLINGYGQPFASPAAFGNKFRDWTREAGLVNRSPHGIRKAAGHLMALEGVSQYGIMSVHGHSEARTSEVYTEGVDRVKLAADAMRALAGMEW